MPKHGFSLDTVPPILINTVDKLGWSLCIGAGTSTPLFPDWYSLVETLSTNILPPELHLTHSDLTKTGFSADALLQAVKNLSEYKSDNFSTAISSALYQNFKSLVDPSEWRAICDVLNSNYWEQTKLDARRIFVKYRNTLLKDLTCTKISYERRLFCNGQNYPQRWVMVQKFMGRFCRLMVLGSTNVINQ